MTVSWFFIYIMISLLLIIDIAVILSTLTTKYMSRRNYSRKVNIMNLVSKSLATDDLLGTELARLKEKLEYLLHWHEASQAVQPSETIQEKLCLFASSTDISEKTEKLLTSIRFSRRAKGIKLVEFFEENQRRKLLEHFLERENNSLLKLKAVHLLSSNLTTESAEIICRSMHEKDEFYKKKVLSVLSENRPALKDWSEVNKETKDPDRLRILIIAAFGKSLDWYLPFLLKSIYSEFETVRDEASEALFTRYADDLNPDDFLTSPYIGIKRRAATAIFQKQNLPEADKTARLLKDRDLYDTIVNSLKEKISREPQLIPELFQRYTDSAIDEERLGYATVLSSRMQYFILKLQSPEKAEICELIDDAVSLNLSSQIIDFLNNNRNRALEEILMEVLSPQLVSNNYFRQQCQMYLKESIRNRWNIPSPSKYDGVPKIQLTPGDRRYMVVLLGIVLFVPFASFLLAKGKSLNFMTGEEILVSFIFHYHYVFAFYTIAVNSIYLFIMFLSWESINKQHTAWTLTDRKFLFTPGILPSISILAPAFNEEKTIIQNVYSLLSLEYPTLELIVINDGSHDKTAERLIEHFELEMIDYSMDSPIETAPLKGIYRNRKIPNLILIDKQNGGKADSLNAGINAASGEFICSIDADSLLESDALTKLMFRTLNSKRNLIAVGGNIIPVNGCSTDYGLIREIHLPENRNARYQTIEYLRSFITGRMGWARLNSLLIISGAFGAFKLSLVRSIGGYMTGKGSLRRDTVGEDMELVVRLVRFLSEKKEKFHVDYAHNANCWTEVPEDMGSLMKQRDRWQRGLIEILIYHKRMLFNPRFGAAGMIAFPYYYLFEMLGPFWEVLGYSVMILSLVFGLLNNQIFLFMFSIVVLFGILISSMAQFLAEKQVIYFKGHEFRDELLTAFAENLGYRQFMSMARPFSFISYLFKNKGWQKLDRKGFNPAPVNKVMTNEK